MLIDEVQIQVKSGDGGNGKVHFLANRHQPKGGPDGGDGGDGGSVYFTAVADISRLNQFRFLKKFAASNGGGGGDKQCHGANGEDLELSVPVGTVVHYDNGTQVELNTIGERQIITRGGRGGHGNFYFRSSTNTTPQESTKGEIRPWRQLRLELKLIAQIGLVGLPNAGKTSLLNELTAAAAKVANYPFTTLEPNLGVMKGGYVIADIPGLIEGASQGKGLGTKFLKHLERTSILIHCLSAESADPQTDYQTVRDELASYGPSLSAKKEIIIVTKSDLLTPTEQKTFAAPLHPSLFVSIADDASLAQLHRLLSQSLA